MLTGDYVEMIFFKEGVNIGLFYILFVINETHSKDSKTKQCSVEMSGLM